MLKDLPLSASQRARPHQSARTLLRHNMHRGAPLHEQTKNLVLAHVERLWGHEVELEEVSAD